MSRREFMKSLAVAAISGPLAVVQNPATKTIPKLPSGVPFSEASDWKSYFTALAQIEKDEDLRCSYLRIAEWAYA